MKNYQLIFIAAITLAAFTIQGCNSKKQKNSDSAQTEKTSLAEQKILQVDDILKEAENLSGKEVELEGICTHICKHGGKKIFLMGSDDTKTIRIEAGKEFGNFKPETVNNIVRVKGKLVEDRIDEAYLTQWEEKIKAQTEEQHGTTEAGCSSEQKARGEAPANTTTDRINNFRKRIAERTEKEGKNYLSFYHIDATEYNIQ